MRFNLYERNGTLYIDYKENNKRIRRSLNLQDTKANREYAIRNIYPKIEDRIKNGIDSTIDIRLSAYVKKAIEQTNKKSTRQSYTSFAKRMKLYLEDKDVTEYVVLDIDRAIEKMEKAGLMSSSIRTSFTPIRIAFNIAFRQGLINRNPVVFPRLKKDIKEEIKPYSLFEVSNLLKSAKGELKTFLYFAFYTGARSGEILALTWGDIKENVITISKTKHPSKGFIDTPKNNKSRDVFILKQLKEYLKTLKPGMEEEFIFKSVYYSILLNFKKLCSELGYKEQGLHSTRHTFISLCVSSGVDFPLIQKMVGHANLGMIMKIYTHYIDDSHKKNELEQAFDTKLAQQKLG